jgi:hypothetical protein
MTTEIRLSQKVSLPTDVLVQHLGRESVLLNLKNEGHFTQNEIATTMFFALTESDSIQTAYNTLLTKYEVEPEKLKQDLLKFINQLIKAELLEIRDA